MQCETCGRFHSGEPGSAWRMVFDHGYPPCPDHEVTRCKRCVEKHGPFRPDPRIKVEFSCGIVNAGTTETTESEKR